MAFKCDICGKGPVRGNRIIRRGLPKKKGGVGLHTTGITPRWFKPNLQRVRVKVGTGVKRMRVCARCLKSGKIVKA